MRTVPDAVDDQPIKTRRVERDDEWELLKARAQSLVRRHGGVAVVVTLTALAAFGLGVMVSRRRNRQSLGHRLHALLPDSIQDLPEGLAEQLKRLRLPDSIQDLPEDLAEQLKRLRSAARAL
jgi:hypothetical protein